MKTLIIVVAIVVVGIVWYAFNRSMGTPVASPLLATESPVASTSVMPTMPVSSVTPTPSTSVSKTPAPVSHISISIQNLAFTPASVTVHKGTTVTWTNRDSVSHTVTGDNGGPSSSAISSGESYSYTFNALGTFPYHCSIHPSMVASVQVIQ